MMGMCNGWLQSLATEHGFQLSIAEFDTVRDPPTDLSVPGFWAPFLGDQGWLMGRSHTFASWLDFFASTQPT